MKNITTRNILRMVPPIRLPVVVAADVLGSIVTTPVQGLNQSCFSKRDHILIAKTHRNSVSAWRAISYRPSVDDLARLLPPVRKVLRRIGWHHYSRARAATLRPARR